MAAAALEAAQTPCDAPSLFGPSLHTENWELHAAAAPLLLTCSDTALRVAQEHFDLTPGSGREALAMRALFVPDFKPAAIQPIGKGGCGSVYMVTLDDGRRLAMKRVLLRNESEVKGFMVEACLMSQLSSGPGELKRGLEMYGVCFRAGPTESEAYGELLMELAELDLDEACGLMVYEVGSPVSVG